MPLLASTKKIIKSASFTASRAWTFICSKKGASPVSMPPVSITPKDFVSHVARP